MTPWQIRDIADLIGWTPFKLNTEPYEQEVKWIDLGDARFDEPFFDTTIRNRLALPETRVATTRLAALRDLAATAPHLAPNGFIFHMSRGGSTLLANALKAAESNLVIAESAAVNQLLRSPLRYTAAERWDGWLAGLIAALGQPRHAGQSRYVLKFSSHNTLNIALIRRVFPEVPWLFLYRDPVEVMVSNLARPPQWHQLFKDPPAASNVLGIAPERLETMSRDLFYAEVLRSFCEAALAAASSGGAFVNYDQLTPDSLGAIAASFGVSFEARDLERMRAVFRRDAKAAGGGRAFTPDSQTKQRDAAPEMRDLCDRLLAGPYRRMERLRLEL